jgi:hypothetical protein
VEHQQATIARYCAIESRFCTRTIPYNGFPSYFVAYPSGPHFSQFYAALKTELGRRGRHATRWEDTVSGTTIFTKVCDDIHAHSTTLCDVTEINGNVLFEAGYALAVKRDVVFLVDDTQDRERLPILRTKEYCAYKTRQDIHKWLAKYAARHDPTGSSAASATMLEMSGITEAPVKLNTLYFIRPQTSTPTVKAVHDQLNKPPFTLTTSDPLDTTFDDFYYQARQIQESELIVGLFVSNKTRDARRLNGAVALLLGIAVGLGKRVLVLEEVPSDTLLDLGTTVRQFEGEKNAKAIVDQWIKAQITELVQARQGRDVHKSGTSQVSKFQDLFLGSPDAMVDYDLLDYFVKTPEFRQARNGEKQLFIGRKGSGKSANFRALQEELGRRSTTLLVSIAPNDFEFDRLTGFLEDEYSRLHHALVYQTYWRYIIFTEVLKTMKERHAAQSFSPFLQLPIPDHIRRLLDFMAEHEDILEEDFATRARRTLEELQKIRTDQPNLTNEDALDRNLLKARMYEIERDLQTIAQEYPIFVLVDEVDKYWSPSYEASVNLLLGLVNEAARLRQRFRSTLNFALYLRQDIFEVLRRWDEELMKRDITALRWDESSLLNMIAQRIRIRMGITSSSDPETWTSLLPGVIAGAPGWQYVVDRSLMRPRDVLHFCQLSIEKAQGNRRERVLGSDVLDAERDYSYNLLKGLRLEYLHLYPGLDDVAFEFVAWKPEGSLDEAVDFISTSVLKSKAASVSWAQDCHDDPIRLLAILYSVGFFGLGDREKDRLFYSFAWPFEEARKLCFAQPYVTIHPGFLSALEFSY